eukprot:7384513-Prymnesium_polylepis.1
MGGRRKNAAFFAWLDNTRLDENSYERDASGTAHSVCLAELMTREDLFVGERHDLADRRVAPQPWRDVQAVPGAVHGRRALGEAVPLAGRLQGDNTSLGVEEPNVAGRRPL